MPFRGVSLRFLLLLLGAECTSSACAFGVPQSADEDGAVPPTAPADEVSTEPDAAHDSALEPFGDPGSIVERLRRDGVLKDSLFEVPAVGERFKPWFQFKTDLYEEHGIRFGIAFTSLYQWTSDNIGPESDAASFDLNFDATWTVLGRGTDSPTTIGTQALYRATLGTEIPPLTLFTQNGSLYSSGAGYSETDPALAQLWVQQRFGDVFGFQVGRIFPITAYDFFPFKNFRTDFVDFNHATNAAIPLPDYGLGGFVMFKPRPDVYLRAGAHDANANVEKSGFDTYDDELFTIFEVGFDPGLTERVPGRPPSGDVHVSIWHQDERDDAGVDDGWGIAVSALQRFDNVTPFVRYGYADGGADGPTPVEHMANVGVVFDGIFGQKDDRIGVGLTWSDPADRTLDDQLALDAYYRIYVTPRIAVSPTFQLIIDPVRNPDEDELVVLGIRTRIHF